MPTSVLLTGLAICVAVLILNGLYGEKIDDIFTRRKFQKILRRDNAKPVLIVNWGTHDRVGKILVAVWADDFYQFAGEQTKKGSQGMYYAPYKSPAAVFTETGYMPDYSPATGRLWSYENELKEFFGNKLRIENNYSLFIPQLNENYADLAWQKKNCGILAPLKFGGFIRRFYGIARTKAA